MQGNRPTYKAKNHTHLLTSPLLTYLKARPRLPQSINMNQHSSFHDPPPTYSLYPEHTKLWGKLNANAIWWSPRMDISYYVDLNPIIVSREDLCAIVKALPRYLSLLKYVQDREAIPLNEDFGIPIYFLKAVTGNALIGLLDFFKAICSQVIEDPGTLTFVGKGLLR